MVIDALLLLCGIFYAVLCVFSIVTGLMYASGKKKLNPLELSDKCMSRYTDSDRLMRFTIKMGSRLDEQILPKKPCIYAVFQGSAKCTCAGCIVSTVHSGIVDCIKIVSPRNVRLTKVIQTNVA